MRIVYLFYLILFFRPVYSQENASVCFVLYVKGEIKKPSGQILAQGDTLTVNDLTLLKFETPGAMVNLFEPSAGSFRMTENEIIIHRGHHDFFNFLKHLLKIKGHPVSLSSRGDCKCVTPQSCFWPDTTLNNKVLLVDQLSFMADDIVDKAESVLYYVSYNNQKRILKLENRTVQLGVSDLAFRDTSFTEGETPELVLALYVKEASGTSNNLLANVRFNIVTDTVLMKYYETLKTASRETDLLKIKQRFIDDVYLFFGKPTECQIDKIINAIKQ